MFKDPLEAEPGPSVLMHREVKGLSALLLRPEEGIPDHLLLGHKDLAAPSKGRGGEVGAVLVRAAPAFEK